MKTATAVITERMVDAVDGFGLKELSQKDQTLAYIKERFGMATFLHASTNELFYLEMEQALDAGQFSDREEQYYTERGIHGWNCDPRGFSVETEEYPITKEDREEMAFRAMKQATEIPSKMKRTPSAQALHEYYKMVSKKGGMLDYLRKKEKRNCAKNYYEQKGKPDTDFACHNPKCKQFAIGNCDRSFSRCMAIRRMKGIE